MSTAAKGKSSSPKGRRTGPKREPAPRRARATPSPVVDSSLRGQFVYTALRQDIRSGRLNAGDRLRETEIAGRLGVSRTPVREALKRLESDGMVSFGYPRGLMVTKLAPDQILELYAMREVLEGAAARFAAERAAPYEITAMKRIIAQHDGMTMPAEAAEANRLLHNEIIAAAHNLYLQRMMNVLSDGLELLGTTTYSVPGRIASGWKENAEIVECIERRDPEAAEQAARRHIRAAGAIRLAMTSSKV